MTRPMSVLFSVVSHWLGTTPFETDRVLSIISEIAEGRGLDLNEATSTQIRALADEAFEIYQSDPAYQGFSYRLEG